MYIYDLVSCQCIQECEGHSGRKFFAIEVSRFHWVADLRLPRWAVTGPLESRPETDYYSWEGLSLQVFVYLQGQQCVSRLKNGLPSNSRRERKPLLLIIALNFPRVRGAETS